jgi:hypothetical protein
MKTFDCVEMKNQIQAKMFAEYEAHKDEYASFVDYVKAQAEKSPWVQRMRKNANVAMRVS